MGKIAIALGVLAVLFILANAVVRSLYRGDGFSDKNCPALEKLYEHLYEYTPSWEELDCNLKNLERLSIPQLSVWALGIDPDTDAPFALKKPEREDMLYKSNVSSIDTINQSNPIINTTLVTGGNFPPYLDPEGKLINYPLNKENHDKMLRATLTAYAREKAQGKYLANFALVTPPSGKWPDFGSADEFKNWVSANYLPQKKEEAKGAEKLQAEYYIPFWPEVDVGLNSIALPELNKNLSKNEMVELAQWLIDNTLKTVRPEFTGKIVATAGQEYSFFGSHWSEINFNGYDEVRFSLLPGCNLDETKSYFQNQFANYRKIIKKSNVTWGIGEVDLYTKFYQNCGTDLTEIEPEIYKALFSEMDKMDNQPVSMGLNFRNKSTKSKETIAGYLQEKTQKQPSAVSVKPLVTFYGWNDNDPPGNAIAFPKKESGKSYHEVAGGVGTYDDPVTMATDPDEFPVGTFVYIPYLQKYVIMEDTCETCIKDWKTNKKYHIDIWVGGDGKNEEALKECEEKWTREAGIELNPPPSRAVNTQPLFDAKTPACL